jgi:hypothetical protein
MKNQKVIAAVVLSLLFALLLLSCGPSYKYSDYEIVYKNGDSETICRVTEVKPYRDVYQFRFEDQSPFVVMKANIRSCQQIRQYN